MREQVALFDAATVVTVVIGRAVAVPRAARAGPLGGLLLVVEPLVAEGLGHPAELSDHLERPG
ncbi:hypothetical protein [Blastococcus sp. SYSU DS0533]